MLGLAKIYNVRPSTLLFIEDEYTAFCFDEACGIIFSRMQNKEEPVFEVQEEDRKHYSSFSDYANSFK